MIRASSPLLLTLALAASPGFAGQEDPHADWDQIEGVKVQSSERVNQINAYERKLREAEKKKLKESWKREGFHIQSEERVQHLNELEEKRREKEIGEIKCTMCTLRCNIVRDAGQASCVGANRVPEHAACREQAEDFLQSCIRQCAHC